MQRAASIGAVTALGLLAALWVTRRVGVFDAQAGGGVGGGAIESDGGVGILDQVINAVGNVAVNPSSLSDAGLAMLQRLEGFSATPYRDASGYSIGYGHFIKAGETFTSIDQEQGAQLLRADVGIAERAVLSAVSVPLSQAEFDACVILAYNIGADAFKRSTLVRLLNDGDRAGAAAQFARWNRSSGMVNAGLVQRRAQEQALFVSGVYA